MTNHFAQFITRFVDFPKKSWNEKISSYVSRWNRWLPGVPPPIRLPDGIWWILDKDFIGQSIMNGGYENPERRFESRFVKGGMTALDIGAHRGYHTLLLSKRVGPLGRVLSFEPSSGDVRRLKLHLMINCCGNVIVKDNALGEEDGGALLYVVGQNTVLNSLRPPNTVLSASPTPVVVKRLDSVLSEQGIDEVDFIKLDVEGGELAVLRGAEQLLNRIPRPIILCELLEQTTQPWGYVPGVTVEHLCQKGFSWFGLSEHGELMPVNPRCRELRGNFVAVPEECEPTVAHLVIAADGTLLTARS